MHLFLTILLGLLGLVVLLLIAALLQTQIDCF